MNYFDAKLEKSGDRYTVSTGSITVELSDEKQKTLVAKNVQSQSITLGVRPSHIALSNDANSIFAKAEVSEMMGSEVHLHANAMGRDVVIIVLTMGLSGNHKETFGIGAEIRFTFGGSVFHVFDHEGKNLEI